MSLRADKVLLERGSGRRRRVYPLLFLRGTKKIVWVCQLNPGVNSMHLDNEFWDSPAGRELDGQLRDAELAEFLARPGTVRPTGEIEQPPTRRSRRTRTKPGQPSRSAE